MYRLALYFEWVYETMGFACSHDDPWKFGEWMFNFHEHQRFRAILIESMVMWFNYGKIGNKEKIPCGRYSESESRSSFFFVKQSTLYTSQIDRFVECKIKSIFGNRIVQFIDAHTHSHQIAKYVSFWKYTTLHTEYIRWTSFVSFGQPLSVLFTPAISPRAKDESKYWTWYGRAVSLLNLL